MRALARFNVLNRLGEISAPTLVITGELDRTVSPKNQRILAERIPNARQVVIPGAGHAVTGEQPEAFNQAMIDFLVGENKLPILEIFGSKFK
jgi:pimeloyl-ACP methyl ester carboxylesterase